MSESSSDHPQRQRALNWERHWASGAAHSCVGTYGDLYGGSIGTFWRSEFARLNNSGARVLDLATGSGAVPRLLLAQHRDWSLSIDAIDIVSTSPPWIRSLSLPSRQEIRFHGGVALESLPFAGESFDLVTSQYGMEYGDLQRAAREAARVLLPDGRFAAVMHHVDSAPVRVARLEMEHLGWLSSAGGLLDATRELIGPLDRARTPEGRARLASDAQANRARDRFNSLQDALRERRAAAITGGDVLDEVRDSIAQVVQEALTAGAAEATSRWQRLRDQLDDSRMRSVDLVDCALDTDRVRAFCDVLADSGFASITCAELTDETHLMGWAVSATKTGP